MPAGKMVLFALFGMTTTVSFWLTLGLAVLALFALVGWSWVWLSGTICVVAFLLTLLMFFLFIRTAEDFALGDLRPRRK